MKLIAIDGACRGNGKKDCIAAGGVFVVDIVDGKPEAPTYTTSCYEMHSTSQRGELLALLSALQYLNVVTARQYIKKETGAEALIVTDSEYIFNTITKGWLTGWKHNNWLTASGAPVKNRDLWEEIRKESFNLGIQLYHIKGHCIPFGVVTATQLLIEDPAAHKLFNEVLIKYDKEKDKRNDTTLSKARKLSIKNNRHGLDDDILRLFVCANVTADAVATRCVSIVNTM